MKITTQLDPNRLYNLVPALYRIADEEQQHALRSLLALITKDADGLRAGAEQLWNDAFIDTCQRWVVPYIGDLVGNIPLHDLDLSDAAKTAESLFTDLIGHENLAPPPGIRTRADVARTIYYRRRKGTPVMLEELARDVTGWGARVVEFFTLLDWNQHLEHLRLDCHGCPELRRLDVGDRAGGAWDSTTHTVDVRRINQWDGWHNIRNIGLFLWRLKAFPLVKVAPRAVGTGNWRFTFSPLGQDTALFSSGRRKPAESQMATETAVETPIRAVAFYDDLHATPPATVPAPVLYGDPLGGTASIVVLSNGAPVPVAEIDSVNLAQWAPAQPAGTRIGVDVTRGRLIVASGRATERITVSYFYGFSGPMGGGHYDRSRWLVPRAGVPLVTGGGNFLQTAIDTRTKKHAVITIGDDGTYDITGDLTLDKGESLTIQADDQHRPHVRIRRPNNAWPILTAAADAGASLTLGGLLVEGGLLVNGDLATLRLLHATLVPGRTVEQQPDGTLVVAAPAPSIVVSSSASINTALQIQAAFSITGALRIPAHVNRLWLLDSIVDGGDPGRAISGISVNDYAPSAHIERTTLFGTCRFAKLPMASESIFTGTVTVEERQQGCVRFSFVPAKSRTPQQYLCQPQREIARQIDQKKAEAAEQQTTLSQAARDAIAAEVTAWLVPSFETAQYGEAAYAQLHVRCPMQIRAGAADGAEMGAFSMLKQPHREANLRMRLDEYLPVGLDAGVIYVT